MPEQSKKKILVVDDEPHIVEMLTLRLEANNYAVVKAFDGLQALERVKNDKPDLILLDILMPRMDGSTFLHQLKLQGLSGAVPIIVLTGKAKMREFFLVEGVVEFIVKPFDSKKLLEEIAKYLRDKNVSPLRDRG